MLTFHPLRVRHPTISSNTSRHSAAALQIELPYKDFPRDVLALIANLSYKRSDVQHITANNQDTMKTLVLSYARFNPRAPVLREWAMLAIRNLTESNQQLQEQLKLYMRRDGGRSSGSHPRLLPPAGTRRVPHTEEDADTEADGSQASEQDW